MMNIVDSHLHVWSSDAQKYGFDAARAELLRTKASAEYLIEQMDEAGVDRAVVIQPITYRFNHKYANECLAKWPDRLIGMCLANPAEENPEATLERLVLQHRYRGVRINPNLYSPGTGLDSAVSDRLFRKCAELKISVGFLVNPDHFEAIGALCRRHPKVKVVIDHFGHCHTKNGPAESNAQFQQLLSLSKHPQLYVKITEWPRASSEPWPHKDLHPWVYALLKAYGANRLMWGTDFPFIMQQCGYRRGLTLLSEETPGISKEDMEWLLGGTAREFFGV